jgi:glycosyltransferase involved in cell wall biosynthesis
MKPPTILHLIETGGAGGAERMMVHLAAGLSPRYLSEAALIRDGWLAAAFRERNIPVTLLRYSCGGFAAIRDLITLLDILKLVRKKQVAIIHTHEFFMNTLGFLASIISGVPLVATVHGKNYYAERVRRRFAYRLVGRFAGQMVAVSEDIRRFLHEKVGVAFTQVRFVPNGVPFHQQPPGAKLLALRHTLALEPDSRVIISVGNLYPVKGHKYLIDAAWLVTRRFPRALFLVVGQGQLREQLEEYARQRGVGGHIRFLGHRDDVQDLLALSDVFVLPSLSEGTPLALLEAMAAGLPSVASRVGGVGEVIENGKTGFLVSPGDSGELADGIATLFQDARQTKIMGQCARERVAQRFSLVSMLGSYQEIYELLLSNS